MKKKNNWMVYIEYDNHGIDRTIDDKLELLAKRHSGKFGGSGFFFLSMTRDLHFSFTSEKKAGSFKRDAKDAYKSKLRVKVSQG